MLNLTPHPINISANGADITIPASGTVARVAMKEEVVGTAKITILGIELEAPVIRRAPGAVEGLPSPEEIAAAGGAIVSAMVLAALPGMPGVYAPDTGATAIRDESGRIVAVTRLVAA